MYVNHALAEISKRHLPRIQYRRVAGGDIRQDGYPFILDLEDPRMQRGEQTISSHQRRDMALAFAIGSVSVSNTITLVKNEMLIGNGIAQPARVLAAKVAILVAHDSKHDTKGAVAYSDSFFPEADGPGVLADAGISAIFASSGSVKDAVVREACHNRDIVLWQLDDKICRGFARH